MTQNEQKVNALINEFATLDREQLEADYRALLETAPFRRVLTDIFMRGAVFGSLDSASSDEATIMKMIGYRECALAIYAQANRANGERVLQAIKEHNALEKEREQRLSALSQTPHEHTI